MASFERDGATIHYDLEGQGFPVLLIAPGGMRSANELWQGTPWKPRQSLVDDYQLIGMDQRNAGRSTAPVSPDAGWHTYLADQLALLDHLGVERCHVVGMCIGGPFIFGLLKAAPERFASAVILQPVGIDDNRHAFEEIFEGWRAEIADAHPETDEDTWASFRSNMWDGDFVLTATRDDVAAIDTPILLLKGDDLYHPAPISDEIASLAPNLTYIERWKDDEVLGDTDDTIRRFLAGHTPTD